MAGSGEIRRLIADLGKIPPDLRKELRGQIKQVAQPILADARRRASWSSRIPSAIRVGARFAGKQAGVSLTVSAKRAPHARPYEHLGLHGTFRHRVYGKTWVDQAARPFFFPAVTAHAGGVDAAVAAAVDKAARAHGFR